MFEYSLEEQTAIIRDGAQWLAGWIGRPVVAHRAGDYTADGRTLQALARNGIWLDSSLFPGNPRCLLNGLGLPANVPSSRSGVTQIPVTVYRRDARPRILGSLVAPTESIRKIDPNWFVDAKEADAALDAVLASDLPYVVVFMHSFSFLSRNGAGNAVRDVQAVANFRAILDQVAAKHLSVATMRDLAEAREVISSAGAGAVPHVAVDRSVASYLWQRARTSSSRARRSAGVIIAAMVALAAVGLLAKRRRTAGLGKADARTGGGLEPSLR
jgi:hypothetical protein